MTIIDQLKQFDEMRGKEPIDPTVIQEGFEQDVPLIDPTPRNPAVPPEWLDEEPGVLNEDQVSFYTPPAPPSPLIPPSVRRSPDAPGSSQTAQPVQAEEIPDLLVVSRNGVCVGVWKGKETELPDESRKAIARIVLKQIQKGISQELESVIEKRGPRKKRTTARLSTALGTDLLGQKYEIGTTRTEAIIATPAKRKPGRPRKVQTVTTSKGETVPATP